MSVERNANADTLTNPVKEVETKPVETEAPDTTPTDTAAGRDYVLNTNTENRNLEIEAHGLLDQKE